MVLPLYKQHYCRDKSAFPVALWKTVKYDLCKQKII